MNGAAPADVAGGRTFQRLGRPDDVVGTVGGAAAAAAAGGLPRSLIILLNRDLK